MRPQIHVIRTERLWIKPHPKLRSLCRYSKNLFNEGNYLVRQSFFGTGAWVKATALHNELQTSANFQALPKPTALKVLILVERAWKTFFAANVDWKTYPEKYYHKPRPPKYKRKTGEFLLWFTKTQLTCSNGQISLSEFPHLQIRPRLASFPAVIGVRIVPQGFGYVVEILYTKMVPQTSMNTPVRVAGIDLGLANLITLVNNIGEPPIVVKGGVAKSMNQYYNKERARLQGIYARQGVLTGSKLIQLGVKRKRKFSHYFHEVSRSVVDWCKTHHIDTLVIGRNKNWKQHLHLDKRTTQSFVFIPFYDLIRKIYYKASDMGIRVIYTNEAYTSKCSFLDDETIGHHLTYQGKRITRGLFQSKKGKILNSDVNGGYNIVKKAVPNAFVDGIEGVWLHPIRWKVTEQSNACQHLVKADKSNLLSL